MRNETGLWGGSGNEIAELKKRIMWDTEAIIGRKTPVRETVRVARKTIKPSLIECQKISTLI